VIENAGILTSGDHIEAVGPFRELQVLAGDVISLEGDWVVLPGLTDAHTHICWAGSRARDYALRLQGKSYLDIAQQGGGIWSTVTHTRNAGVEELTALTVKRAERLLHLGTTTRGKKRVWTYGGG
jgi:imidazolonepropionase